MVHLTARCLILLGFHALIAASCPGSNKRSIIADEPPTTTSPEDQFSIGEPIWTTEEEASQALDVVVAPQMMRAASLIPDQTDALNLINAARAEKGLDPMQWNFTLQVNAYSWAAQLAELDTLSASPAEERRGQGEISASITSTNLISDPIKRAAELWLRGEDAYNGEVIPEGDFPSYGQYTQLVWNTTTDVGIAAVLGANNSWKIVARFTPPGNIRGRKPY